MARLVLDDDIEEVRVLRRTRTGRTVSVVVYGDDADDQWEDPDAPERVTLVGRTESGAVVRESIAPRGRTKRQAKALRPIDKALRKLARRQIARSRSYLERHERSNRSKKNGWVKDFVKNFRRALKAK